MIMECDYKGKSFVARDARGSPLTVTPYFRLRTVAGAMQATLGLAEDCVGLRTEDGRRVERKGRGLYALDGGETLVSSEPGAV